MRPPLSTALLVLTLGACGGDGTAPAPEATQLAFTVQPAAATAGQVIAPPIQVSIEDAAGNLVSNATNSITLSLASTARGATLGGTPTATAVTGVATFPDLTVSRAAIGYTLTASATDLTSATSAAFDVAFAHGVPTTMVSAGSGTAATVGQAVEPRPTVRVVDGYADAVSGIPVTFSVTAGNGTIEGAEQTTGADGTATVGEWHMGALAGTNTLTASAPGLEPLSFDVTGTAGAATTLALNRGEEQAASPGSAVAEPPSVLATDIYGNPVPGVTVTFEVLSGGGSVTDPVQVTGENGAAFVGSWTLGPDPGENTLTATADGLSGSPVTFHATARAFPSGVTIEVRNDYFRSLQNGTGGPGITDYAHDTVAVGGTVTWVWAGQNHNVTPAFGTGGSGTHDAPHTYTMTFHTPGSYVYRCTNHSQLVFDFVAGMAGAIEIR
jgi:adhesin/invasin